MSSDQGLICVLLLSISLLCKGEVFSSSASVELLVAAENLVIKELETYVRREENRLAAIRRSLERIRNDSHVEAESSSLSTPRFSSAAFVGHPVNALHVISRWEEVQAQAAMGGDLWAVTLRDMKRDLYVILPDGADFLGSIEALIRLQETYQLSTDDLARGVIDGVAAKDQMTAYEMYAMGKAALRVGSFGLAVQWLNRVLNANDGTLRSEDVLVELADAYHYISQYSSAVEVLQLAHNQAPGNAAISAKLADFRKINATMPSRKPLSVWEKPKTPAVQAYQSLCRGEMLKPTHIDAANKPLRCLWKRGKCPFIRYKEEILNVDPFVVLFHDVMTDREAKTIKMEGLRKMERAQVSDTGNHRGHSTSTSRVSKLSWLWDDNSKGIVKRLSDRVADITSLKTDISNGLPCAEPFQVLNYGIGGQFEPHLDYFEGNDKSYHSLPEHVRYSGDRLATFMFYMNDVRAGGATVFPHLKLRIPPTRNAAAFWYNIDPEGNQDPRTEHAGCPVLLGQKWVANKWIHEHDQQSAAELTPSGI